MKWKQYVIYIAGGERIGTIRETCITNATKQFVGTLDRPAKYELYDRHNATVRYNNNIGLMNDFLVMEA
ncbi:hypothetical protein QJ48_03980 [Paenibacillus sp. A3]|uniref:hypothetical protein n=1 Tax=Paenibacillus sp. A3 TaxID=1337054 RepID=UPI0006D5330D|nr:hypothetical protein [Paenibacillus sp. A3]KPV60703.1 hypothetical protein QJ48_03980 [Paenibacillus sp. A3]